MITFKVVRFKNFLSTGDQFTEIPLNTAKSTLIVGHNGAGKSTILDALSLGFGTQTVNTNDDELYDSINIVIKDLKNDITYHKNGGRIKIDCSILDKYYCPQRL